jgi:hypothetical protein
LFVASNDKAELRHRFTYPWGGSERAVPMPKQSLQLAGARRLFRSGNDDLGAANKGKKEFEDRDVKRSCNIASRFVTSVVATPQRLRISQFLPWQAEVENFSRRVRRRVSEYSEIVFQKHNGLCATWNQATTCSTKSDYSDALLEVYCFSDTCNSKLPRYYTPWS